MEGSQSMLQSIQLPNALRFATLPPLALYIHLPWCVRKCPYCDFNSHLVNDPGEGASAVPLAIQQRYVQALMADLETQLPNIWGRRIVSIFMGGGTPSLFEPALIDELLAGVRARLGQPLLGEITMEANPGTFEAARFEGYRKAGVNRLSLGVQSFSDDKLKALGRVHNGGQAIEAARCALALFDEVNFDLMYGLPGQTVAQAAQDVQLAADLAPTHLSLYQLTLEPNTLFAVKPPQLPAEDDLVDIEDEVHRLAKENGYERYEVSAFSKKGHSCKHNLNYWGFGDYLGIGAGAHGKISFHDRVVRHNHLKNPQAYMESMEQGQAPAESRTLKAKELPFEFMLNALRLVEGVPVQWYSERCGRPLLDLQKSLLIAREKGLLEPNEQVIKPTPIGFRFLNDLQSIFL